MTHSSFITHMRIVGMLLWRDMKALRGQLRSLFINGFIVVTTMALLFCKLFPLLGMPHEYVGPLFVGNMVMFMFFGGFSHGIQSAFDLEYNRFIDYHLGLPLPKHWLFAQYVMSNTIEMLLVSLPLIVIGSFLVSGDINLAQANWPASLIMMTLTIIVLETMFIALSTSFSFKFFTSSAWPRILSPLFGFSAIMLPWKAVHTLSPAIGNCMLLNPFTHATEGLRAALLGQTHHLPLHICIPSLLVTIVVMICCMRYGIKKRLDPV